MGALQPQLLRDPGGRIVERDSLRADLAEAALGLGAVEPLYERALEVLAAGLGAEAGCVVELDVARSRPRVRVELGFGQLPTASAHWLPPSQRLVAEGEPLWLDSAEAALGPIPMPEPFGAAGFGWALGLPIGQQGAIWIGGRGPLSPTQEDRRFAEAVSRIVGSGVMRLRNERELLHFRASVDHLRDAILVMRSDGKLLDANQTAVDLYGYSRAELFERSILDLRAGTTLPEVLWQMRRAGMTGLVFETVHRRKDGSQFRCEVRSRGAMIDGEHVLVSLVRALDGTPPGTH